MSAVLHLGDGVPRTHSIKGETIKTCDIAKDSGMLAVSSLKFIFQADKIACKWMSVLFTILRNVTNTDAKIMLHLYKTFGIPRVGYCSPI
ncbi:hypothetical protein Y032_0102g3433 [Ancylostoma ceylanicum]|nr:hypothetical protein Y032_0102g3433 [Ancylostoma ceylanicum]